MKKTRREFLTELGLSVGAIVLAKDISKALSPGGDQQKGHSLVVKPPIEEKPVVDFRYAPKNWQSTYCFPDDPYKSLVGKHGELLYGHQGVNHSYDEFSNVISLEEAGGVSGTYVSQSLESPSVPIITTKLEWPGIVAILTSFATKEEDEGRVDNLIVEYVPSGADGVQCSPVIAIKSSNKFVASTVEEGSSSRKQMGVVRLDAVNPEGALLIVDSPIVVEESEGMHRFTLQGGQLSAAKPMKFFLRFPQEGQKVDKVKDGLEKSEQLLKKIREYWQLWKPFEGKVNWNVTKEYQGFLVASARNILESRELKSGQPVYHIGPTVNREIDFVGDTFILEAVRYLGHDTAAQHGLEYIWNLQQDDGSFVDSSGEKSWKDTAAAVFSLCRQSDLSQNWSYFNEVYPDAYKALMRLRDVRKNAMEDGTLNSKYGFLPQGYGGSGLDGIRSELTNTIWTMAASIAVLDIADRLFLDKRWDIRAFLTELTVASSVFKKELMKTHPSGFRYLPMLLNDDPQWSETDERKQPRPQLAQMFLSQALYPGFALPRDGEVTSGQIELMKAVMKEDIPIETGWLNDQGLSTCNAAAVAQLFLWRGERDLARKTFIGFLNHASPLYNWREEQSLQDAPFEKYVGDMPNAWASAECIRYLRHMLILENKDELRLLHGLGRPELALKKPMTCSYSPTKYGRITISHEPAEKNRWITRFRREEFDPNVSAKLKSVILPRKLPTDMQFDKLTGATFYKNGPEVFIDANAISWEASWVDLSK